MIQHKSLISIAMVCSICDGKEEHSMPCVMVSWTAWLTVGWDAKVIQKSVYLMKEAGQPYDFFGVANWPTLCNLCSYFVLNCIIDNYNINMNMVIYLVDPVHLLYGFYYYKLSFTGTLICLFGCNCIFLESALINILFSFE